MVPAFILTRERFMQRRVIKNTSCALQMEVHSKAVLAHFKTIRGLFWGPRFGDDMRASEREIPSNFATHQAAELPRIGQIIPCG